MCVKTDRHKYINCTYSIKPLSSLDRSSLLAGQAAYRCNHGNRQVSLKILVLCTHSMLGWWKAETVRLRLSVTHVQLMGHTYVHMYEAL